MDPISSSRRLVLRQWCIPISINDRQKKERRVEVKPKWKRESVCMCVCCCCCTRAVIIVGTRAGRHRSIKSRTPSDLITKRVNNNEGAPVDDITCVARIMNVADMHQSTCSRTLVATPGRQTGMCLADDCSSHQSRLLPVFHPFRSSSLPTSIFFITLFFVLSSIVPFRHPQIISRKTISVGVSEAFLMRLSPLSRGPSGHCRLSPTPYFPMSRY